MEFSKTLNEAIKNNNVLDIRSALYTIAHEDPSFKTSKFIKTFNEIKNMSIPGLIDKHEGELNSDKSSWNDSYWSKVASDMVDNFSVLRVEHLIEVGKSIYSINSKEDVDNQKYRTMRESRSNDKFDKEDDLLKFIITLTGVFYLLFRLFKKGKK